MPLKGFKCPSGYGNVPLSYCEEECPANCYPLPMLASFDDEREVKPGHYSGSELPKPAQQVYLTRNFDYWVDPESRLFMTFGTAVHHVFEGGLSRLEDKDRFIMERRASVRIETKFGEVTFSGKPDLIDTKTNTMYDYKVAPAYTVNKHKRAAARGGWFTEDDIVQQNIYRAMFHPGVKHSKLVFIVRNWSNQVAREDKVKKIEIVDVPLGEISDVTAWVHARVSTFLGVQQSPEKCPLCTAKDTWDGRRCRDYCDARDVCGQAKREMNRA